ncbi:hypothetical protein [Paludisphaera rhizosphaerae]|uniref:hypothetical protein n=1 Tax=Paludisphaera rhizosphaerae TaxID=2711216 RepID=UPI0013EA5FF9|nr:hypothetical protein [Paludisphaera rhizosphaerae]
MRMRQISPIPWFTAAWIATATVGLGLISYAGPARSHDSQPLALAQSIPVEDQVRALSERVATLEAEVKALRAQPAAALSAEINALGHRYGEAASIVAVRPIQEH